MGDFALDSVFFLSCFVFEGKSASHDSPQRLHFTRRGPPEKIDAETRKEALQFLQTMIMAFVIEVLGRLASASIAVFFLFVWVLTP